MFSEGEAEDEDEETGGGDAEEWLPSASSGAERQSQTLLALTINVIE
jgi:hypothetical protein